MDTRNVAARVARLERHYGPRRVDGMSDEEVVAQLAAMDPQTRAALEALSPEDFNRWMSGMMWFAAQQRGSQR